MDIGRNKVLSMLRHAEAGGLPENWFLIPKKRGFRSLSDPSHPMGIARTRGWPSHLLYAISATRSKARHQR